MIAYFIGCLYVIVSLVMKLKIICYRQINQIEKLHLIGISSTLHCYKVVACLESKPIICTTIAFKLIVLCRKIVHIERDGSGIIGCISF